jgi:hypothetical protein
MNTTIETSSRNHTITTQRPRVSLATIGIGEAPTPEVTGHSADSLASSVVLSTPTAEADQPTFAPAAPAGHAPLRFSQLGSEERQVAKDTLKQLSRDARVWVRDNKTLRRADPAEIKERLDRGQPVEIVSRMGSEVNESSSRSYESDWKQRGVFSHGHLYESASSSASRRENVTYTTSPITSWDSLDFVDTDGQGVQGTPFLPASGGSVTISNSYEKEWRNKAEKQWGVFNHKEQTSSNSGHTRIFQEQ